MKPAGWQPIPTLALPLKGRGCLALPPLEGEGVFGSPPFKGGVGGGMGCGNGWRKCHAPAAAFPLA
jgi:hypothetical protein